MALQTGLGYSTHRSHTCSLLCPSTTLSSQVRCTWQSLWRPLLNSYRKGLAYEGRSIDLWLWTASYMIGTIQKCQRRYISIIPSFITLAFPTDKISMAITAHRIFNRGLILNRKRSVRFEIYTEQEKGFKEAANLTFSQSHVRQSTSALTLSAELKVVGLILKVPARSAGLVLHTGTSPT